MNPTYDIHLAGVDAVDLPVVLLRDLCDVLLEGAQRAARLAIEGRSIGRGPPSSRIGAVSDVRVSAYRPGSLNLSVSAPRLLDALPGHLALEDLSADVLDPEVTAIDLLMRAANDALDGQQDSDYLDPGILDVLARTHSLFSRGVTEITFFGSEHKFVLDLPRAEGLRRLRDQTPGSRVARVLGVLDSVTLSTASFVMRLNDGSRLRGLALGQALPSLATLIGQSVVAEGALVYRPSGRPARIEADLLEAAQPKDRIWSQLPLPEVSKRTVVSSGADLGAVFGRWPGDESDEEIFAALERLS